MSETFANKKRQFLSIYFFLFLLDAENFLSVEYCLKQSESEDTDHTTHFENILFIFIHINQSIFLLSASESSVDRLKFESMASHIIFKIISQIYEYLLVLSLLSKLYFYISYSTLGFLLWL